MENVMLNIGCGDKKFDDFVNIDLEPGADIQADVTDGVPFPDNSVAGIYCEHFIEHLSQSEAIKFLRECRRVLVPDGMIRIATLDLDHLTNQYKGDWKNQAWIKEFGYDWIDNKCEVLNIVMREWGHKWLFNQEELMRIGDLAGLSLSARCNLGESEHPIFRSLEWRKDSSLIIELKKRKALNCNQNPLVSILIPAYNNEFLSLCIESALNQTYPNIEIIICDDSQGGEIKAIIEKYVNEGNRIQYFKNEKNLRSVGNYIRCFSLANGDFIKFLNDDDLLHPTCVSRMVECFTKYPEATLITSHRQCIDSEGDVLPELEATQRPNQEDSIIKGVSAAGFMLAKCINFIGEPSTTMFRRCNLQDNKPNLLSFAGRPYVYNVDVVMWVNLLSKGDLIYLSDSLSYFRLHENQEQRQPGGLEKGTYAWQKLREDGLRMGIFEPGKACELLLRALETCPQKPDFRNLWGTGDYERNIELVNNKKRGAIQINTSTITDGKSIIDDSMPQIDIHLKEARAFLSAGDLKASCDSYRRILDIDEQNFEAIKYLGIIACAALMHEKALVFLKRANEMDPSDTLVINCIEKCTSQNISAQI